MPSRPASPAWLWQCLPSCSSSACWSALKRKRLSPRHKRHRMRNTLSSRRISTPGRWPTCSLTQSCADSCLRESATVMTRQGKGQGYERGATNTNPGPCSIVVGIERCSSRESNGKGYHAHFREHTRRAVGSLPAGWNALWGLTRGPLALDGGHGHYPASRGRDRAYTAAPSKPDRLSPYRGRDTCSSCSKRGAR